MTKDRSTRFAKPSYRVIVRKFEQLEEEIRKRTAYRLDHVTQLGDDYTLFFQLKPAAPDLAHTPERIDEHANPPPQTT